VRAPYGIPLFNHEVNSQLGIGAADTSSNTVIAVSSDNDIDNEVLAVPISSQEEKTVLQTSTARIAFF
jgi:hypothetical protein